MSPWLTVVLQSAAAVAFVQDAPNLVVAPPVHVVSRSRMVWVLPSQLNAVRRLCARSPCAADSIRISTYCAVLSPPFPDMISSMLAKWKTACPGTGTSTASRTASTTTIRDMESSSEAARMPPGLLSGQVDFRVPRDDPPGEV